MLPRALRHMMAKADEPTKARLNKVIRVWDERKVGAGWGGVGEAGRLQGRKQKVFFCLFFFGGGGGGDGAV